MNRRNAGNAVAAGGALLVLLVAGAIAVERSRERAPASPEVLEQVARKNHDAAMAAAARMKAQSQAAARDADARLAADAAPAATAPSQP